MGSVTILEKYTNKLGVRAKTVIIKWNWIFLFYFLFLQIICFFYSFSSPYESNKLCNYSKKEIQFLSANRLLCLPRSTYRLLTLVLDKICMQSIILRRDHDHWLATIFFVYGSELSISFHTELLHLSFYFTFIECNFPLLRLSSHK